MNVLYGQIWLVTTAGFNPVYLSRAFKKVERFVAFCAELLPLPTPFGAGPSRRARDSVDGLLGREGRQSARTSVAGITATQGSARQFCQQVRLSLNQGRTMRRPSDPAGLPP